MIDRNDYEFGQVLPTEFDSQLTRFMTARNDIVADLRAKGIDPTTNVTVVSLGNCIGDFLARRGDPSIHLSKKANTMTDMVTSWIPEAPGHHGLYANQMEMNPGKLAYGPRVSTYDIHSARMFETREECQAWCDANPVPVFVPVEHGFYGWGGEVMATPTERSRSLFAYMVGWRCAARGGFMTSTMAESPYISQGFDDGRKARGRAMIEAAKVYGVEMSVIRGSPDDGDFPETP